MVKTREGKSVMVMMDAKAKVTKGTSKIASTALNVGDRIVASAPEDKAMITAET
jgi:hypothetical protein